MSEESHKQFAPRSINPPSSSSSVLHRSKTFTHIRESTAGADGVIVAHPALVVWVLSPGQNVLVAGVVGLLVQHPAAALHLDGVAAAEVGVHVGAVGVALIGATLEVSVLIKYDLSAEAGRSHGSVCHRGRYKYTILDLQYKPCTMLYSQGNVIVI